MAQSSDNYLRFWDLLHGILFWGVEQISLVTYHLTRLFNSVAHIHEKLMDCNVSKLIPCFNPSFSLFLCRWQRLWFVIIRIETSVLSSSTSLSSFTTFWTQQCSPSPVSYSISGISRFFRSLRENSDKQTLTSVPSGHCSCVLQWYFHIIRKYWKKNLHPIQKDLFSVSDLVGSANLFPKSVY